jgi:hypothetical protein
MDEGDSNWLRASYEPRGNERRISERRQTRPTEAFGGNPGQESESHSGGERTRKSLPLRRRVQTDERTYDWADKKSFLLF